MKQFFYTIIFTFFSIALFGQAATQDGTNGGGKPVIEDIGARGIINTNPVDNMVQIGLNTTSGTSAVTVNENNTKTPSELTKRNDAIAASVKKNMRFYPNPAYNDLNVDLGQLVNVEVRLMNVIGQEVYLNKGEFDKITIDVSDFPKGSYFLSIKLGKENIVKRIEIVK